MQNVIAIFDIGKTNKKFFLIDENYSIILEKNIQFNEATDEDGDPCEDVKLLSNWVVETFTDIICQDEFDIKAINFSAYGASLVYINKSGKVIAPLYNYLKKYPEQLKTELYAEYGNAETISCETASPELGSLNSGLQLYRINKEKPALYTQLKYALHLPQYISYLVTHIPCSDITSIGCHTQLWDFNKNDYHQWVKEKNIGKKLAPILPSDKTINISFGGKKIKAGVGLHDSSAALIPYLAAFKEPFILLSTGTWNISLNPFNNTPLTNEELKKDCLCYFDYMGKPVKASRLFAGHQHEQEVKKMAEYFNRPINFYKNVKYDPAFAAQQSIGTEDISSFANYEEAYHHLMLDIIKQQYHSTSLVLQNTNVNRIFVDGGFSNNSVYMHLLAQTFSTIEVYAASVAQASAMGAALAIHKDWNINPVPTDIIKLKHFGNTSSLTLPGTIA